MSNYNTELAMARLYWIVSIVAATMMCSSVFVNSYYLFGLYGLSWSLFIVGTIIFIYSYRKTGKAIKEAARLIAEEKARRGQI